MSFDGFPREALVFLDELERHNERAWFDAHRDDYERTLLDPAREFVTELGDELRRRGIDVEADPRVNRSIRRIARDTRFSRDKRPYKTHLDLWFWHGSGESGDSPGFWFRLGPRTLTLGAGMHRFGKETLERYRDAVVDPERGRELASTRCTRWAPGRSAAGTTSAYRAGSIPSTSAPISSGTTGSLRAASGTSHPRRTAPSSSATAPTSTSSSGLCSTG